MKLHVRAHPRVSLCEAYITLSSVMSWSLVCITGHIQSPRMCNLWSYRGALAMQMVATTGRPLCMCVLMSCSCIISHSVSLLHRVPFELLVSPSNGYLVLVRSASVWSWGVQWSVHVSSLACRAPSVVMVIWGCVDWWMVYVRWAFPNNTHVQ